MSEIVKPKVIVGDINFVPADPKHKRKRDFGEIPLDIGPLTMMYLKLKRPENPQKGDAYKVIAAIDSKTRDELITQLTPKLAELAKMLQLKLTAAEAKKMLTQRFSELTDEGYEDYYKFDATQNMLLPFNDKDGNPVAKTVAVVGPEGNPATNLYLERGTEALIKVSVQLSTFEGKTKCPFRLVAVKLTKPIDWVPEEGDDTEHDDSDAKQRAFERTDFSSLEPEY